MASSRGLAKNTVRDSGRPWSVGLIRCWLVVAGCYVTYLAISPVQAAITTSGDVVPAYAGADPWIIGGPLVIAKTSNGSMTVGDGSDVTNTHGRIGDGSVASGTVTIDGSGSSWTNSGQLDVGWEGSGELTVRKGATLNSTGCVIGNHTDSDGTLTVDGTGSFWRNHDILYVGAAGTGTLAVQNDASIETDSSTLGFYTEGSGTVNVNGINSHWENYGSLTIGYQGSGTLNVQNGGSVSNTHGWVGYGTGGSGSATVDGFDSIWYCTSDLSLGRSSNSGVGSLTISNEGSVWIGDGHGFTGWLTVSDGDSGGTDGGNLNIYNGSILNNGSSAIVGNNTGEYGWAKVDGAGSTWNNNGWLYVGHAGSGTLTVQNGGSVSNMTAKIGCETGSIGTVTVDGANSNWECTSDLWLGRSYLSGLGSVTISNGGTVWVGDAASDGGGAGWLTVSDNDNSGSLGGNLYVYYGNTLTHSGGAVVGDDPSEFGWATVDGAGSSWSNGGALVVGYQGSGTLNVQNGATVSNTTGWLGQSSGSSGTATVDGRDSSWINNGRLNVGYVGSGILTVQNGGSVSSTDGRVGYYSGGTGTVTVDGAGSNWECTGDLWLGKYYSSGVGSVTISNGGTVWVGDAARDGGGAGWLTVSDADSTGTEGGHIYVYGGGTLDHCGYAVIGDESNEYGWVTVDGNGSSWITENYLHIGLHGSGELSVQNGGSVSCVHGRIAYHPASSGTVTVDGANSCWTNSSNLYVGVWGTATLAVLNGGSVCNTGCWIGSSAGGTGTVTVTGSKSTWRNTGDLSLGHSSNSGIGHLTTYSGDNVYIYVGDGTGPVGLFGSWLIVSDFDGSGAAGGHLYIYNGSTLSHGGDAIIGNWSGNYGWATVDGVGSSWTNSGRLNVGYSGSGTLTIQDGGTVSNTDGYVGCNTGATGTVTVAGSDSVWENTGNLSLGHSAESGVGHVSVPDGGTLLIGDATGGGQAGWLIVSDADSNGTNGGHLYIYNGSTLTHGGNAVLGDGTGEYGWTTIDGSGSSWVNNGSLDVGRSGSGSLTIQNGGSVSNTQSQIGFLGGSVGTATVDGSGSSWTSSESLVVGYMGSGTLTVQNGGSVSSSAWLGVGEFDSGTLTVQNGGNVSNTHAKIGGSLGGSGTVTIDGIGSSWGISGSLSIGGSGSGTLTVQNGGSVSSAYGSLGYYTGGTGTVTVIGGSTWENTGNLSLGRSSESGLGHLTISDGGTVWIGDAASNGDATGWLIVSDVDSSGMDGGHLCIYNGSTLTHGGIAVLGEDADEYGWATVDGAGSRWTNGETLLIGYRGSGTLDIQDGATVSSFRSNLGYDTGGTGTATVTDFGSAWTNNGLLVVGFEGAGMLTVENGATVSSGGSLVVGHKGSGTLTIQDGGRVWNGGDGSLGLHSGASGSVAVNRIDSSWECTGNLSLGASFDSGVGSLTTSNGGTIYIGDAARSGGTAGWLTISDYDSSGTAGGHLYLYNGSTLTHGRDALVGDGVGEFGWATVDGTGSSWTNDATLVVGFGGSGALAMENGGSVSNRVGWIGYGAGSTGTVTVDGTGSSWTNALSLYVGGSGPGTLAITAGGLVSVGQVLTIDMNTDGDSFINMATGGMLALFGDADDSLLDFLDLVQGTDAIRWWDESISDWAPLTTATEDTDFTLEYLTEGELLGYTLLTVGVASLPGDLNGDGFVGGDDLDIIRSFWGQSVPAGDLLQGDPSGDGFVGGDDLDIVRANWGQGTPPSSVPEPSTLAGLLALGLAGILGLMSRR